MEVLLAAVVFILGVAVGALCLDWRDRRKVESRIEDARGEFSKMLADLSRVHNSLAARLGDIQEQLNAHEMKINGRPGRSTQWTNPLTSSAVSPE